MKETILAFIERINTHDVEGLGELMSDEHTFVDAHGNQINGKDKRLPAGEVTSPGFPITTSK